MDTSSDDEQRPAAGAQGHPAARLRGLLQLIAGGVELRRPAANSNEDLVQHLWRGGVIKTPTVKKALLACPRHLFMPPAHLEEAYVDSPVRVEEHGFNISAPHIHALALESLELKEGDRFLDVGCGSGLLSAAAALLVGRAGRVHALDVRPAALRMTRDSLARLREQDAAYAAGSCEATLEEHNCFVPTQRHAGKYNKVYVGAACPADRLRELLKFMSSEPGSLLLVPVESELLLYRRLASGKLGRKVVSAVRFSELEVPRDVDIVMATLQEDLRLARTLTVPPGTLDADLAPVLASSSASTPTAAASPLAPARQPSSPPAPPSSSSSSGSALPALTSAALAAAAKAGAADLAPAGDEGLEGRMGEGEDQPLLGTKRVSSQACPPSWHEGTAAAAAAARGAAVGAEDDGAEAEVEEEDDEEEEDVVKVVLRQGTGGSTGNGGGAKQEGAGKAGVVAATAPKRRKTGVERRPSYVGLDLWCKLGAPDCFFYGTAPPAAPPGGGALTGRSTPRPASAADLQQVAPAGGAGAAAAGGQREGAEWRLPAHRAVLQARCEHLRARFLSGMRDASEGALAAPEGVAPSSMRCMLRHVYADAGVDDLPLEQVAEVLHLAQFYGCRRLVAQCERRLADVLTTPEEGADEMAAQLLALADEVVLPQLKQLALSYIVERYGQGVRDTEAYRALPRALVDEVAACACQHAARVMALLRGLSDSKQGGGGGAAGAGFAAGVGSWSWLGGGRGVRGVRTGREGHSDDDDDDDDDFF